jgi:PAS domain S-box-containing protein
MERDNFLEAIHKNNGSVSDYEIEMYRKDGSIINFSANSHFIYNEQGDISGIEGTLRDITESKKTRRSLEVSEIRLKRSQSFANIGTWDWDIQSGELFWSERIGPLFGYHKSIPETTYENFINAVHPDDRDMVTTAVQACVSEGKDYNIEHRVIWDNGSTHWMLEQGDVIRAADGTPLHMLGVVQDITHRKHAEIALMERERQLREAQALAQLGSWQANLTSGELRWSDEIYRIFGHEPGNFTPSVEAFQAAVHPDDVQKVLESERLASETGLHDVIHRIVRPDGSIRHVHELAHGETDMQGNLIRLVGTVQDITEQVLAEQALIAARDEAEEANRAKSQFLSSMSHELRTPMNAILGFGQLLEMDVLNAEQLDYVQEILKAGHHLLELINEVLDLAKIESGRLELSIESVCFGDTLAECLSLIGPMLAKHQVSLEHDDLACRQIHILADNVRLKQVLINLLSNAIKYNRPQGNIKIHCEPTPDGASILVSIVDTGIGISPKAQTQLFKPFTRIDDKNNNIEGTGIGLVITKNLVKLMGGEIGVESQLDNGSTFWFTLPSATAGSITTDRSREVDSRQTSTVLTNSHRQYTILYIEDNPTNLRLVQQVLSRWPHIHLLAAHEPNLGLDLLRAHQPDLVLLDINLPEMDGYEVFKRMQSIPECGGIPVVAVSANAMPRDIERGMQAGFNDYITKPIQVASFLTSIANILELAPEEAKPY